MTSEFGYDCWLRRYPAILLRYAICIIINIFTFLLAVSAAQEREEGVQWTQFFLSLKEKKNVRVLKRVKTIKYFCSLYVRLAFQKSMIFLRLSLYDWQIVNISWKDPFRGMFRNAEEFWKCGTFLECVKSGKFCGVGCERGWVSFANFDLWLVTSTLNLTINFGMLRNVSVFVWLFV